MKVRWLGAAALIAVAGAAAWLVLGTGTSTHDRAEEGDAGASGPADGAARPGLAAAKPSPPREAAVEKGRSEIVGVVRRDGKPTAARVEARLVRSASSGLSMSDLPEWTLAPTLRRATVAARAIAAADGTFALSSLAPGWYSVRATADDGASGTARARVEADGVRVEVNPEIRSGRETLRGRIVHGDGTPWKGLVVVAQAQIEEFSNGGPEVDETVETDAEGRFTRGGLVPGAALLCAIAEGSTRVNDFTLRIPFAGEYVLVIDRALVDASGRVVDATGGAPIAGATVDVWAQLAPEISWFGRATSDASGRYRLAVPPGKGGAAAEADGYASRSIDYEDPKQEVEIRLTKSARLRGRVTSAADGKPVEGVTVECRGVQAWSDSNAPTTKTDADGRYALDVPDAGEKAVVAAGAGWIASAFTAKAEAGKNPFAVKIVAGGETVLDLTVVHGARLTGVVLDPAGQPVPRASVDGDGNPGILATRQREFRADRYALTAGPVATADDGSFVLDALVPGAKYQLVAAAPGFAHGHAGPFEASLETTPRVEIRLPARRWANVTVLDAATAAPVPGALVTVEASPKGDPSSPGWFNAMTTRGGYSRDEGRTDAKGVARVGPLGEGELRVFASAEGFLAVDDHREAAALEGGGDELAGAVRLTRGLEITGQVLLPDGSPAAGARIESRRADDSPGGYAGGAEPSDAAGSFRLAGLPAGRYSLRATLSTGGAFEATATADAGASGIDLRLEPAKGRVVLRVLDPDGKPVPSARAHFEFGGHSTEVSVRSGRAEFQAADIGDATGTIVVDQGRDASDEPGPWGRARVDGATAGGTYEIRLPPELVITGRVVGPDGRGVPGASLQVVADPDVAMPGVHFRRSDPTTTETGADGAFRFGGLSPGDHWIAVDPPAAFLPTEPTKASAGAADVRIVLRAGVVATITVLDASGAPVAGARVAANENGEPGNIDSPFPDEILEAISRGPPATAADGTTRIPNLDPTKRYTLTARAPRSRGDLVKSVRKEWPPADTTVTLSRGYSVSGLVRDSEGRPISGADVRAVAGGAWFSCDTSADGTFRIGSLPAGDVQLVADVSGLVGSGGERSEAKKSVTAGTEGVVLTLDLGLGLQVHVEGAAASGRRSFGLAVLAREGAPAGETAWDQADREGVVHFQGLRQGATYALWIEPNDAGESVYAAGLKPGEVHVRFAPGKTITGHIAIPTGAAGAYVEAEGLLVVSVTGRVASDGSFTIAGLPDGVFEVKARAQVGGVSWRGSVEVKAGGTANLTLAAEAAGK